MTVVFDELRGQVEHLNLTQIQAAKCLVSLKFSEGEVKREFVVIKPDRATLSKLELCQKIDEIQKRVEADVNPALGDYKSCHCLLLVKDTRLANGQPLFHYVLQHRDTKDTTIRNAGPILLGAIEAHHKAFSESTGFPVEPIVQGGEFAIGIHCQPLDPATKIS